MKRTEATDKFKKKRGHYFWNAIDVPYGQKYVISPTTVNFIRTMGIYRKMKHAEILDYLFDNLQNGIYDSGVKRGVKEIRQQAYNFLLTCSSDDFAEITHLTKFDYE